MCWEITASANVTVLSPSISVLNMKSKGSVELRGEIHIQRYIVLSPFLLHKILSLVFGSQKFRLETCCLFCAEINFLYLHSPLKIQMLVSNCGGCIASKISNKPTFLNFATPNDWVQHPPLCRAVYTVLIVMTELVSVFRSFWGPGSLKTCEKHLCELGWPLSGLTGRAGVEDVSASRGFFRVSVLFLGYQTNHCVFIKASLCK